MFGLSLRGAGRRNDKTFRPGAPALRCALLAAGALLGVLPSAPALADIAEATLLSVNNPTIIVENNGSKYTKVQASSQTIIGEIEVHLDAEVTGRVKSFFAYPQLGILKNSGWSSWHDYADSGYSKSYSTPRPKSVTETFGFSITRQKYADLMVLACNMHADKLRAQGKSNQEIFSKNRTLAIAVGGDVDAEISGPDRINPPPQEITLPYTIGITCKRDDSLDPVVNAVKDAVLVVHTAQVNHQGACELQVSGTIVSATPYLELKFRYHSLNGDQSDLKTVTTDDKGFVNFLHTYPLAKGSKQSGKIRMIGVSHAFMSNWADFAADCDAPPQNVATVLPPKAVAVEAHETGDTVMVHGRVCPAKVKIWGVLKGRGDASGAAALFAAGKLKALKQYQIADGQTIVVQGEQDLSWDGNQSGQQNVLYRMNVSNAVGDLVDHVEQPQNFICREPKVSDAVQGAPGGYAADVNAPQSLTLSLSPLGLKRLPGYSCPDRVRMHSNLMSGDKPLTGTVALFVNGSLVKEMPVDHAPHYGHNYDTDVPLSWNAATKTEQTLIFTAKFANQFGAVLKSVEKTADFACDKITVNEAVAGGPGGLTGSQKPSTSQPGTPGQLVVGIIVPQNFAIQAPKGIVKAGAIQLSGAQPTASYSLKFFRKSGGGYTQVSAAQLPKVMKGMNASFPLSALTGGRNWRLQVCPAGQAAAACQTSDFRIAFTAAKQDEGTPPKPAAKVFLLPGATN